MCEMQKLRVCVEQILTAAAEEILGAFKRSIAEIEEKLTDSPKHNNRKQKLPDAEHQTDILIPPELQEGSPHVDREETERPHIKEEQGEEETMKFADCPPLIQKLWMVKEELLLEQQERRPRLEQMDSESPHNKKVENLWTNQEVELLQRLEGADITKFFSTPPSVKGGYDEDEAQSSELHHSQTEQNIEEPGDRDDYGGFEPDSIQNNNIPIRDTIRPRTQHQRKEEVETCEFASLLVTQMTDDTTKKLINCSVCKKGFSSQSIFKRHMLVHTGEKPFSCSVCGKGFTRRCYLKEHMSVHTGERPFTCSVCKKGFMHKGNLSTHMLLVHRGEKPFSCSVCDKVFARKYEAKRHMLVHATERPFICLVCKKGFPSQQNLKRHEETHRKEGFHPPSL